MLNFVKIILRAYYQEAEFIPGKEKIEKDIADSGSSAYGQGWLLTGFTEAPTTSRGWCGEWKDNAQGVNADWQFQWCAIRRYKDFNGTGVKTWGPFEEPILWSNWSEAGGDGESIFTAFAFTTQPENVDISDCTLSGGSFASPVPTGTTRSGQTVSVTWSSALTSSSGVVWMTSAIFSNNPQSTIARGWDAPKRMSDSPDFEVIYSARLTPAAIPSNFDNSAAWWSSANQAGWFDNAADCGSDPMWMATLNGINGVYEPSWNVMKVRGNDSDFTSLAFANLEDGIDISNCTVTGGTYDVPIPTHTEPYTAVTWTDSPTGSNITWMVSRKYSRTNTATTWSHPIRMVDTSDFETLYSNRETPGTIPSGFTPTIAKTPSDPWWTTANHAGWFDNASGEHGCPTDAIWMATNTASNGVFNDNAWQIIKVKGEKGNPGDAGYNTTVVYLYKRSSTGATIDWNSGITYNFATGVLVSAPAGWSNTIPQHTANSPLYVTAASPRTTAETYTIAAGEWATPVMLSEDGTNGTNGFNSATIRLYMRTSGGTPSAPGTLRYTFATGELSGNTGGWSTSIPDNTNGYPCYTTQGTAISTDEYDDVSEWATVTKFVEDGTNADFVAAYTPGVPGVSGTTTYNAIPTDFDDSAAWWSSANQVGWYASASACSGGAVFMATIIGRNGVFNDADWQIVRVKGDKGDPGSSMDVEYLKSAFGSAATIDNQDGVFLREFVGVTTGDSDTIAAFINGSTALTTSEHGKIMFASGVNGITGTTASTTLTSYVFAVYGFDSEVGPLDSPPLEDCYVTGGTIDSPIPTETIKYSPDVTGDVSTVVWLDSPRVPSSPDFDDMMIWMTSKTFYGDGTSDPSGETWEPISLLNSTLATPDTKYIFSPETEYGDIPIGFDSLAADDPGYPWWEEARVAGWYWDPLRFPGRDAIWMAKNVYDGVLGDWTNNWEITKIKSETPIITGGTAEIDANTIIFEDGLLETNNAQIRGTITGSNIYGGRITGATISGGLISGVDLRGGSLSIGNSGQFSVTSAGKMTAEDATINGNITLGDRNKIEMRDNSENLKVLISADKIIPTDITTASTTFLYSDGGLSNKWEMNMLPEVTDYGTLDSTGYTGHWAYCDHQGGYGQDSGSTGYSQINYYWSMTKQANDEWLSGSNPTISISVDVPYDSPEKPDERGSEGGGCEAEIHGYITMTNGVDTTGTTITYSSTSASIALPLREYIISANPGSTISIDVMVEVSAKYYIWAQSGYSYYIPKIEINNTGFTLRRRIIPSATTSCMKIGTNGIEVRTYGTSLLQFYKNDSNETVFVAKVGSYTLTMDATGIKATNGSNQGFKIDGSGFSKLE